MSTKKQAKHGGARVGAGRKTLVHPEGRTVVIGASVPGSLVDRLDRLAETRGWSRSQAVTEAIRRLVRRG